MGAGLPEASLCESGHLHRALQVSEAQRLLWQGPFLHPGRCWPFASWRSAPPAPKKRAKQEGEEEEGGIEQVERWGMWWGQPDDRERTESWAVGVLSVCCFWQAFSVPFYILHLIWRCSLFP